MAEEGHVLSGCWHEPQQPVLALKGRVEQKAGMLGQEAGTLGQSRQVGEEKESRNP